MSYLEPHATHILTAAGFPTNHARAAQALACAQTLIDAFTRVTFGASLTNQTLIVPLSAGTTNIPVPPDVTAVQSVSVNGQPLETVYGVNASIELGRFGVGLVVNGEDRAWQPGRYTLIVTRGVQTVPQDVVKAASLLVAWFLALSDPDQSRYANLVMGDFSGSMRFTDLPVPEAQSLLTRWRSRVAVTG